MNERRTEDGRPAEEDSMAKDETTMNLDGKRTLGPLAWLEDIDSPEEVLPAWVLAKIDRTVERWGRRWSDAQTAAFRRQMAWTLATHPDMRRLVEIVEEGRRRAAVGG